MKNQKGGELKVYLDDRLIGDINSKDNRSSTFVWEKIISDMDLAEGRHVLELENVDGFNAVNIFAVLPDNEMNRLLQSAFTLASNITNVYILEAE